MWWSAQSLFPGNPSHLRRVQSFPSGHRIRIRAAGVQGEQGGAGARKRPGGRRLEGGEVGGVGG